MSASTAVGDPLELVEAPEEAPPPVRRRVWNALWPRAAAIVLAFGIWQVVFLSGWRPEYVLPGPATVLATLAERIADGTFWAPLATTLVRASVGFTVSIAVGTVIGLAVARFRPLRTAVGSLITGLQTMPSIAWFPLAILLFQLSERAILFVVVLGAAPSIANGIISGVDDLPPSLLRAGKVLGARGLALYRYVVVPAALPAYLAGLKQGWAFAWRSLMAGELLAIVAERAALGQLLAADREFADAAGLMSTMIVILVVGMVVDGIFGVVTNGVRRRRGLGALRL
jgi:NitT/TauT family transport system permease protein